MAWWVWLVVVVAALALLAVAAVWVQSSRRSGTVIAVQRGRGFGRSGRDGRRGTR
ncbi:hypothetical protein ACIPJS_03265 [Streptomyces sp. NPDC086783]|uniref:hypothetical protein n=1 Tax=Streptomyces sp. NPDC086783 TaxID=3365758 RepID=UPI0038238114